MIISTLADNFRQSLSTVSHFVKLGIRTALFLRIPKPVPEITPFQLVSVIVLAQLLALIFGRLDVKGPAIFYPSAIMWGWIYTVISLWVCWFVVWKAKSSESPIKSIHLFAIVLTQSLAIDTVSNIAYLPIVYGKNLIGSKLHWGLFGIVALWGAMAFIYLLLRETRPGWKAALVVVGTSIAMPLLAYNFHPPRYWYADQPNDESETAYLELSQQDIEKQLQVAENQRNGITPGRKGKVELFSISFAPYGSEDVFLNESTMINKLMLTRFGAAGHNQELINHVNTNLDKPWATLENLERAINQSAKRMNKNEDVLFIYLTSHGSQDFKLSASYWPLKLDQLTPQTLNLWLDKAGIKNRVIAVSACYSGGWIDVLKNDHTLVMTAADKDHTSYGCGRKSDLTYFGNAVFREGLQHTHSFEKAFRTAVPVIKKREEEAGKEDGFSNPQIYIGSGIKPVLEKLELQLDGASASLANQKRRRFPSSS